MKSFTPAQIRELMEMTRAIADSASEESPEGHAGPGLCKEFACALEYLLQFVEWKPIESAPKECRSILVFGGLYDRPTEVFSDGGWWNLPEPHRPEGIPTHWRELPPPPEEGE